MPDRPPPTLAVISTEAFIVLIAASRSDTSFSIVSTDALAKLISFGSVGIYIAFQMVVLAALRARIKGWMPSGKYRLGRWAWPVNIGALVYGIAAIVNISWPRTPGSPWYDNYIVVVMVVIVVGLGLLYMITARSHLNGTAPHADAVPAGPPPASELAFGRA